MYFVSSINLAIANLEYLILVKTKVFSNTQRNLRSGNIKNHLKQVTGIFSLAENQIYREKITRTTN